MPIRSQPFDYSVDFTKIDFRKHPELYRIGKGEQGVLMVQPYKGEILPFWRFKTPEIAQKSAEKIYDLFQAYLANGDFVGADMARKFLQMGYTRSRRYYWHASGQKFKENPQRVRKKIGPGDPHPVSLTAGKEEKAERIKQLLPNDLNEEKKQSAAIFKIYWDKAKSHPDYLKQKEAHLNPT